MGFGGVSGWQLLVMLFVVLPLLALAVWGICFIIKRAVLSVFREWDGEQRAKPKG